MRRIVTGNGGDGRSTVLQDGPPATVFHFTAPDEPHHATPTRVTHVPSSLAANEAILVELWATDRPLAASEAATAVDPTQTGRWDVECPEGGTRWRFVRYGPDLVAPLHQTATLDYDLVLTGTVDLVLEDGTTVTMAAGDAVVIPGVVHGWRAGPEGCTKLVAMSGLEVD